MRVGLFSNAYRPVVSGVVNSLVEIRRGLLHRGHTPFLFAPEVKGFQESHAGVFRFPSVDLDPSVGFPVPIPVSARLARLIPRMNLSLIHSHHPILIGAAAANFARKLHLPLVYTFHTQIEQYTHYVPFFRQQYVKERTRKKMRQYLSKCDTIICPSPGIRPVIESYNVGTPIVDLPNAIDLTKFQGNGEAHAEMRRRLSIPQDALVSLSVGRLATEKGLTFLFQAFAALERENHHLVVVGSGPQNEELVQFVKQLGVGSRVHFLGAVPYEEMPAIYAQSDLFVICSTTEVKPLVVLEALASGLPVIAVSACGTADTLTDRHDGRLCDGDPLRYREAWDELLGCSELRTRMARNARTTASGYSIETYLERLCSVYQETLERTCRKNWTSATG
ncbi:MAG: glycosyltransferase [Candidatus Eremiobacteraeota bacterium]|nr:glycosyltransferase [Candidatus Eremiobacteraeota bacterium]